MERARESRRVSDILIPPYETTCNIPYHATPPARARPPRLAFVSPGAQPSHYGVIERELQRKPLVHMEAPFVLFSVTQFIMEQNGS